MCVDVWELYETHTIRAVYCSSDYAQWAVVLQNNITVYCLDYLFIRGVIGVCNYVTTLYYTRTRKTGREIANPFRRRQPPPLFTRLLLTLSPLAGVTVAALQQ